MGKNARTFGQDLMRGEHVIGGGMGKAIPGGSREPLARLKNGEQSVMRGGRPANAAGKIMNEKLATNRAKLQKGLAIGTQQWVSDRVAEGDIAGGMAVNHSGTSIFDPVLCELVYRWFCPPTGLIIDPFAGGSVRGIVASKLGRKYVGVDLSARQISANEVQAKTICKAPAPRWIVGDSRNIDSLASGYKADLIFSCPPYGDLEVYSEDENDLSAMSHADFRTAYAEVISKACGLLKPDRFACFVIGDARDRSGFYYGLPWLTVEAFQNAGMHLYNEAVLLTAIGSLPIRVAKQFTASRKLGKTHQNVLVFVKGDPVKATKAIGEVEFGSIEGSDGPLLAHFGEVL